MPGKKDKDKEAVESKLELACVHDEVDSSSSFSIPDNVVLILFEFFGEYLEISDFVNIALVCTTWNELINDNVVWDTKLIALGKKHGIHFTPVNVYDLNCKVIYKNLHELILDDNHKKDELTRVFLQENLDMNFVRTFLDEFNEENWHVSINVEEHDNSKSGFTALTKFAGFSSLYIASLFNHIPLMVSLLNQLDIDKQVKKRILLKDNDLNYYTPDKYLNGPGLDRWIVQLTTENFEALLAEDIRCPFLCVSVTPNIFFEAIRISRFDIVKLLFEKYNIIDAHPEQSEKMRSSIIEGFDSTNNGWQKIAKDLLMKRYDGKYVGYKFKKEKDVFVQHFLDPALQASVCLYVAYEMEDATEHYLLGEFAESYAYAILCLATGCFLGMTCMAHLDNYFNNMLNSLKVSISADFGKFYIPNGIAIDDFIKTEWYRFRVIEFLVKNKCLGVNNHGNNSYFKKAKNALMFFKCDTFSAEKDWQDYGEVWLSNLKWKNEWVNNSVGDIIFNILDDISSSRSLPAESIRAKLLIQMLEDGSNYFKTMPGYEDGGEVLHKNEAGVYDHNSVLRAVNMVKQHLTEHLGIKPSKTRTWSGFAYNLLEELDGAGDDFRKQLHPF